MLDYFLFKPQSVVIMPVTKEAAASPKRKRATWPFSNSVARTSVLEIVDEDVNGAVACLPAFAVACESDTDFASPLSGGIFGPYLFA